MGRFATAPWLLASAHWAPRFCFAEDQFDTLKKWSLSNHQCSKTMGLLGIWWTHRISMGLDVSSRSASRLPGLLGPKYWSNNWGKMGLKIGACLTIHPKHDQSSNPLLIHHWSSLKDFRQSAPLRFSTAPPLLKPSRSKGDGSSFRMHQMELP